MHSQVDAGAGVTGRVPVCQGALKLAYGVSNNSVQAALAKVRGGTSVAVSHKEGQQVDSEQHNVTMCWFNDFFDTCAERMPDCNGQAQVWHLSPQYSKQYVHAQYAAWCQATGLIEPFSYGHFTRLWSEHFSHVTIPDRARFAQCGT